MCAFSLILLFGVLTKVLTALSEISNDQANNKVPIILDGTPINVTQYPFYVNLDSNNCGGAIISKRWILTAAHCVAKTSYHRIWVGGESLKNSQQYNIDRVIINQSWDIKNIVVGDIAMLRVSEPLRFSDKIKPAKLPAKPFSDGPIDLVARGKDEIWYDFIINKFLDFFRGVYFEYEEIKVTKMVRLNASSEVRPDCNINGKTFCAVRENQASHSCYGDSGSPLVRGNTLIGIVSSIDDADCRKATIVYCANVNYYVPWIKKIMKQNV